MPNIKLYGFADAQAESVSRSIHRLFSSQPWQKKYVVTIIHSTVTDFLGESQPYLELVTDRTDDHFEDIYVELKTLGFYIEVSFLGCYFDPKE